MIVFFLFSFGLAVGSFLNVLIDRLPRDESVVRGRSYCERCKKSLLWYDLIPLVSFVLLKGKCRYCHSPISFYYPTVELATGLMFVLTFFFIDQGVFTLEDRGGMEPLLGGDFLDFITLSFYLFIVATLIVVFFADLKYGIIPDKIVYLAIIVVSIFLIRQLADPNILISNVLSAIGAFLFFFLLYLVTRGRGMGFGDVKLVFLLGLFLGFPKIILALYFAFLTGAFVGCILILWRKKRLSASIPFGPFLSAGAFIAMFLGDVFLKLVYHAW